MKYRVIKSDIAPPAPEGWSVIELAYTGIGQRRFVVFKA